MEQTLKAIVLRRKDAGESDRRLTLLSEERGLVDVTAKGARKAASRLSGASEPLTLSVFQITTGRRTQFVTQVQAISAFPGLRGDFERLSAGLALAEVLALTTPHERPEPELFELAYRSLRLIEVHERPLVALAWAEVRLLEVSGHLPSFDHCVETGKPIQEAEPWFDPTLGGYIVAERASGRPGRIRTKAEVLVGLSKLAELELPPSNLRFLPECLRLLNQIWQEAAHHPLAASEALLNSPL